VAITFPETALEVLEQLGVYQADNPILTPAPSLEFIDASIERECARRVFWLIYISDALGSVLYRRPILANETQLKLRLPVDETTFLFTVHDSVPGWWSVIFSALGSFGLLRISGETQSFIEV